MGNVLRAELADLSSLQPQVCHSKRATRKVDDRSGERFIERRVGRAETSDASTLTERLGNGPAKADGTVLGGVVVVDSKVTDAIELYVEARVLGKGAQ